MTNPNFRRTLVGAAVAAALVGLAPSAGAAPFRGTFDPHDFEGEYIINVSPACLQTDGWHANTGICAATLLSTFADTIGTDPDYTGRLTFAPPEISDPDTLFGIFVYGGLIDGFDTAQIHHVNPAVPPTVDEWWIQFVSGQMPPPPCEYDCYGPLAALADPAGAPALGRGVYLFAGPLPFPALVGMANFVGPAQDIGVPEPGTISLVLGALGGGWLARRRRKKQEADSS